MDKIIEAELVEDKIEDKVEDKIEDILEDKVEDKLEGKVRQLKQVDKQGKRKTPDISRKNLGRKFNSHFTK